MLEIKRNQEEETGIEYNEYLPTTPATAKYYVRTGGFDHIFITIKTQGVRLTCDSCFLFYLV